MSEQQREAIRVLDWLYDPQLNRREGRTHAQAVALIRVAARYPGTWVIVRDHAFAGASSHHIDRRVLLDVIERLSFGDPELAEYFQIGSQRETPQFRFLEVMRPIEDWLPEGEVPLPGTTTEGQIEAFVDRFNQHVDPPPMVRPTLWEHLVAD